MRLAFVFQSLALTALTVLPLVSAVPVPDAVATSGSATSGATKTAASSKNSAAAATTSATTSATASATESSTETAAATIVSSTEASSSIPTQNSWVEASLDFTEAQRSAFDHLTYNFEQDGLDSTSALTFANVLEFQEAIWEKLNSKLNAGFDDVSSRQTLIIALIAGGLGGFLLCGMLYALVVSIRCCRNKHRAKKQRKLEERNSFTMVSPSSRRSIRKSEKEATASSKNGDRWPIDSTPTPARTPVILSRNEHHELSDRRPPTPSSRGAAPAYSGPRTPTPRYTSFPTSHQPPRLTISALPSAITTDSLTSSFRENMHGGKPARPSTAGRTSISDILAEFDFDVDDDIKDRDGDTLRNGHPGHNNNESSWTLGTNGGRHRTSDEGSQIGIVTGKEVNGVRGERRDGKFYRKSRIMPM